MQKELAKVTKGEFTFDLEEPTPSAPKASEAKGEGGGKKGGKKKN